MKKICDMTAVEISTAIKAKEITVTEAVLAFFDEINKYDGILHCFNCTDKDQALKRAVEIQKKIDRKELTGLLAGVPVAVKDNILTKDFPTTCSSKMLNDFISPYNATVIERLLNEGAILIGKLNMDEFAMGSTTESSCSGLTRNPWDISKVPGGSSGGSAACVSARLSPVSLGTDTGGSIRQPCSFCGVSGLKPTYGSVSRYGLVAYASSFDQIGPIAKDVDDCAALYSVICGKDGHDSTVSDIGFDFKKVSADNISKMRIGIPEQFLCGEISEDVKNAILKSAEVFKYSGAEVEVFSMPILKYAVPAYYIIACAQASSNLARYDGVKFGFRAENCNSLQEVFINSRSQGFGMEVKRRIMLGSFVLSSGFYEAYYKKALKAKRLIENEFLKAFEKFDIILSPVSPTTANKIGEFADNPLGMYLGDIYTVPVNLAGLPAFSCPCGFDKNNMPIGMQLIGKHFKEEEILSAAKAFQNVTDFRKRAPGLSFGGESI